jgi:hypothetical protein
VSVGFLKKSFVLALQNKIAAEIFHSVSLAFLRLSLSISVSLSLSVSLSNNCSCSGFGHGEFSFVFSSENEARHARSIGFEAADEGLVIRL